MARTLRKRAAVSPLSAITTRSKAAKAAKSGTASIAKSAPKKRTARSKQIPPKGSAKTTPKRKPRPHRAAIPAPEPKASEGIPAPPYRTPTNPQATLLGLPAELRLQIYAHLNATALIHVHRLDPPLGSNQSHRYIWTPCKGSHTSYPLLCANPKWSGLCAEEDRCTFKKAAPPAPRGFYGLAATNKFIRGECMEFFMKDAVVSINITDELDWVAWLEKRAPRQLKSIRRITIAGPQHGASWSQLSLLNEKMSGIEEIGFQLQTPRLSSANLDINAEVDVRRWKYWGPVRWARGDFWNPNKILVKRHVTVIIEGTLRARAPVGMVIGGKPRYVTEQQVVVRVVRKGKADGDGDGTGWEDRDVKLEVVQPGGLVEPKRTAGWRRWWRGKATKGF